MDEIRFDALARSLTAPGSRRRALAIALGGAFLLRDRSETVAHDALLKCKKLNGEKKKKCVKKAKKHNAQDAANAAPLVVPCVPTCPGTCGPDGCGGTCGTCGVLTQCCTCFSNPPACKLGTPGVTPCEASCSLT